MCVQSLPVARLRQVQVTLLTGAVLAVTVDLQMTVGQVMSFVAKTLWLPQFYLFGLSILLGGYNGMLHYVIRVD